MEEILLKVTERGTSEMARILPHVLRAGYAACGRRGRRRDLIAEVVMRYRPFGRTGLQVSVVGFGCWPMAGDRYGAIEDDEAIRAIHRALDRGVNCVDTAPAYGAGHSEEVVARALEGRRKDVILVTKCGVKVPPPGQPGPLRDASRANIFREVEASLKRLRTDWVDVLLVHWPDASTPVGETMRALEEVVASGRVRFVGVSNFTGAMLADCMRTRRVDVSQVGYHLFDRRQEQETFPFCRDEGIGVMGYGSLGHGLLTGAFTTATTFDPARDWRAGGVAFGQPIFRGKNLRTNVGVVDQLRREVADPRGVPLSQIALAWVLGHPAISTALVGARTPAEVDANDAGAELELSSAERAMIDAILAGAAGRVREFTPLRPAMEPWGSEQPPARGV
jgi:aryl-alcohol dehydrogenase-like predicted oxidoreductase